MIIHHRNPKRDCGLGFFSEFIEVGLIFFFSDGVQGMGLGAEGGGGWGGLARRTCKLNLN